MKRSRFSEEQIITVLKEAESEPVKVVCARHKISQATSYQWKNKFGGMEVEEARRLRALEDENSRLKRLVADYAVQIHILKEVNAKKNLVSPTSRRRAVKYLVAEGLSTATQACRALDLARSSYYLVSGKSPSSQKLSQKIVQLSEENPRYGYRRITALLRRRGRKVNSKRVKRVRREAGLQVRKKQKRRRRLGPRNAQRLRGERRNQVWSWDLIYDQFSFSAIMTLRAHLP